MQLVTLDAYAIQPVLLTQRPAELPILTPQTTFGDYYFLQAAYQLVLCHTIGTFMLVLLYLNNYPPTGVDEPCK